MWQLDYSEFETTAGGTWRLVSFWDAALRVAPDAGVLAWCADPGAHVS